MRKKAVFAAVVTALLLAVVSPVVLLAVDTRMEQRDSLTVYCLDARQHEQLTGAGVALGLTVPKDVTDWPATRPDDFWRACEALSAARQAPGPGVFTTVLPVLTAVLGAVLAFAATAWRDRVTQGGELATQLRERAAEFHRLANARLNRPWRSGEPDDDVVAARAALATSLARVRAAHPDWPAVAEVTAALAGTGLDADGLDELRDGVERIARAVARPLRATVVAVR